MLARTGGAEVRRQITLGNFTFSWSACGITRCSKAVDFVRLTRSCCNCLSCMPDWRRVRLGTCVLESTILL